MGERPAIVFVHGAGDSPAVWADVGKLVEAHGVDWHAVDLVALSGGRPCSIEEYAGLVVEEVETRDLDQVALAGHSMGSLITIEVGGRQPRWLGAVVPICVGYPMAVSEDLLTIARDDPTKAHQLIAKWSHDRAFFADHPEAIEAHAAAIAGVPEGTLADDLAACDAYGATLDRGREIDRPVTVVVAGNDRMVPPDAGRTVVDAIDGAAVVELAGVGHRVQAEAPEAVAEILVVAAREAAAGV